MRCQLCGKEGLLRCWDLLKGADWYHVCRKCLLDNTHSTQNDARESHCISCDRPLPPVPYDYIICTRKECWNSILGTYQD